MAFLENIDQLRGVTWGAKYLWDIRIEGNLDPRTPGPPAPFDKWFPAVNVEEDIGHIESFSFETHQTGFRVPSGSQSLGIRVTFYDDEKHTLLKWMDEWVNKTILNNGQFVSSVGKSVKLIHLLKLNHKREELSFTTYTVYPEGTITYEGDSGSDAPMYSVNFVVVGKQKVK